MLFDYVAFMDDDNGTMSRIGAAVVAVGAVAVVLGLTVLPWYRIPSPPGFYGAFFRSPATKFFDVHNGITNFQHLIASEGIPPQYVSYGVAISYFGWLAWVLLIIAAAFAAASVSPFGAFRWWPRWVAAVAAFAGGGITITALDLVTFAGNPPARDRPPSFGDFVGQTSFAPWVVVVGYTLILAGSFAPHPVATRR